jgi:hypothetical protein
VRFGVIRQQTGINRKLTAETTHARSCTYPHTHVPAFTLRLFSRLHAGGSAFASAPTPRALMPDGITRPFHSTCTGARWHPATSILWSIAATECSYVTLLLSPSRWLHGGGDIDNLGRIVTWPLRPLVNAVLHGFNGTLMAYGQTGTGKTYVRRARAHDTCFSGGCCLFATSGCWDRRAKQ